MADKAVSPSRAEATDVKFRPMFLAGIAMVVALTGVVGLAAWLYPASVTDPQHSRPVPRFADPPLQPNTAADMTAFRAAQLRRLNSAGWVDQAQGIAHIPIDQAMHDVARDGIPDWPTQPYRARP